MNDSRLIGGNKLHKSTNFTVLIFYKSFGDLEKVIASRPIDFFKKFISLPVD